MKDWHKIGVRLSLWLLLLFFCSSVGCLDTVGSSATSVVPGCSGFVGSELTISDDTSAGGDSKESNFEGPVSLPVTISKNDSDSIPTVDPTSVQFQSGAGGLNLTKDTKGRFLKATATSEVGIVYFKLNDASCNTVGVVMDGTFIGTLAGDSADSCQFAHTITSNMIDNLFTYVPFGAETTTDNDGAVGYPFSVRVNTPENLIDDYTINAFFTMLDSTSNVTELQADIQETTAGYIMIDGSEYYMYPALTAGVEPSLWVTPLHGGFPEEYVATDNLITTIEEIEDDAFIIDENDIVARLFGDATSSELDLLELSSNINKSTFAADPSGTYLAYETTTEAGKSFGIYEIATGETLTQGNILTADPNLIQNPTSFELDWIGQTALVAIISDGELYQMAKIDITNFLSERSPDVAIITVNAQLRYLGNPNVMNANSDAINYICEGDNGVRNICMMDIDYKFARIVLSLGVDIDSFDLSNDGISYLVFESAGQIGTYKFSDESLVYHTTGRKPSVSPYNDTIITYFEDMGDTTQVGIINVGESRLAEPLELMIVPKTKSMATLSRADFRAEGGTPPYTFDLVAGGGTVQTVLGTYFSLDTAGEARINVTDALGNVATAVATIGAPGTLDTDYGQNGVVRFQNGIRLFGMQSTISAIKLSNRYLVAGDISVSNNLDFYVAQLDTAGKFDTAFGTNGVVTVDLGGQDTAKAVGFIGNVARIVVGETTRGGQTDIAILKLGLNGTVDLAFGNKGIKIIDLPNSNETVNEIVIQGGLQDAKITIAGYTTPLAPGSKSDMLMVRIFSHGDLDPRFSGDGILTQDVAGGNDRILDITEKDNYYYLAGDAKFANSATPHCFLSRMFTANGQIDESLGGKQGIKEFDLGTPNLPSACKSIVFSDASNRDPAKIIVGGSYTKPGTNTTDWLVMNLDPELVRDNSFNKSGVLKLDTATSNVQLADAMISKSNTNSIYLAGTTFVSSKITNSTMWIRKSGIKETLFGNDGINAYSAIESSIQETPQKALYSGLEASIHVLGLANLPDGSKQSYVYKIWR